MFYTYINSSFTGMTPQGCEREKRVCQKLWHEDTTKVLLLSIYMGVLAILKEYVMVFQVENSPVCSGPSSEKPLTGNHPVEEVRITFKVFFAILPGTFFFFCYLMSLH